MNLENHYKVCILTAGKGSRLGSITDKINKAILPLNDKAIISHIIDKFSSDTEFVIATGFESETVEHYLHFAYPNGKFKFVEIQNYDAVGSGPGHSLLNCEEYLQCPFIFFSCDTVVTDDIPPCSFDWVGISKTNDPESFCTVRKDGRLVSEFIDKSILGTGDAFIGLAGVFEFKVFFEGLRNYNQLTKGEVQITAGLEALIKNSVLKYIHFNWFDTGTLPNYKKACNFFNKEKFDFSKTDEYIYFKNNRVIKFFSDNKIAHKRYYRSKKMVGFVPEIIDCKHGFYAYEFLEGEVLYERELSSISQSLFSWLHNKFWVDANLTKSQLLSFKGLCLKFYQSKTIARLKLFSTLEKNKDFYKCAVNGIQIGLVSELLKKIDWLCISKGVPSRFHGDLQFDNIVHSSSAGFKLIDWRQDFSGLTNYGDRYYDYAKLLGGMIVSYSEIKQGNFAFSYEVKNANFALPETCELDSIKLKYYKFLDNIGADVSKVCIITSLIFLNMAPLHAYPFSHILYCLGRVSLERSIKGQLL